MKIIKTGIKYIFKHKGRFLLLVLISVITSVISIVIPYISGYFIDNLLAEPSMKVIWMYAALYIGIAIFQICIQYIIIIFQTKVLSYSSMDYCEDVISHIQKLPLTYFKDKDSAYVNQKVYGDTSAVISFTLDTIIQFSTNIFSLVILLYLVFKMNAMLCLLFAICSVIYLLQYIFMKRKLYDSVFTYKEEQANFFSSLYEQIEKIKLIKVFNCLSMFHARLRDSFSLLYNSILKSQKITYVFQGSQTLIAALSKTLLLAVGGMLLLENKLSIGMFSVLISYFGMLLAHTTYFVNLGQSYITNLVSLNRVDEIMNEAPDCIGNKDTNDVTNIVIKELTFCYEDDKVISSLSQTFTRGHSYGIIGKNGAGKTTLVNVILGLIGGYTGTIYINNVLLNEIDVYKYRQHISLSTQEPLFFSADVLSNLSLGNPRIEQDVLDEMIDGFGLIKGKNITDLNYVINSSASNLSGGELQKISLIRTLVSGKSILVFDEPTTFLDSHSKKFFIKKISQLKQFCVIIIVTHDDDLVSSLDSIIKI